MRFSEVFGHKELKASLCRTASSSRIAHAQLFSGPGGAGMLPLAVAFARYLLCKERHAEDACGQCPSCKMVNQLSHPDLHFAFPFTVKKEFPDCDSLLSEFREAFQEQPYLSYGDWMARLDGENKQGIIPVKESENILRKLSIKSYGGGFKIQIIWLPEKMNAAAANKLLKLLEEPPDQTLFLLVSEYEDALLPTILSRTQRLRGDRLRDEEIREALIQKKGLSQAEASTLSFLAAGNLRDAFFLASQERSAEDSPFERFRNWMRLCYKGDVLSLQKWVLENAEQSREAMKGFLVYSLHMIRESLVLNYGDEKLVHLSGEEMEFLRKFSGFIHKGNCRRMIEDLNEAAAQVEWNANLKILLTDLSLRFRDHLKIANPEVVAKV